MAAIALALGLSGVLMVFHSGGGLSYLQLPAWLHRWLLASRLALRPARPTR